MRPFQISWAIRATLLLVQTQLQVLKIDQRFKDQGINGAGMVLNVTDSQSISDLLEQVGEKFGAPTVLINNAGITKDNLLRMKDDEWFDVIDTTFVYISKACLKPMTRARWGRGKYQLGGWLYG